MADAGTAIAPRAHEQFVEYLARRAEQDGSTRSFDVAANQMDKLLTAETEQEIWDADEGGTFSAQDMTDIELRIRGYKVAVSSDEYDSPLGHYILIDAVRLDTGDEVIVNTGAALIITKLRMLESRDLLPVEAVIRGTKAAKGTVLKLKQIPARAVQSQSA
jgi:hypothetical protein